MSEIHLEVIDGLLATMNATDVEKNMLKSYFRNVAKDADGCSLVWRVLLSIIRFLESREVITDLHRHVLKNLVDELVVKKGAGHKITDVGSVNFGVLDEGPVELDATTSAASVNGHENDFNVKFNVSPGVNQGNGSQEAHATGILSVMGDGPAVTSAPNAAAANGAGNSNVKLYKEHGTIKERNLRADNTCDTKKPAYMHQTDYHSRQAWISSLFSAPAQGIRKRVSYQGLAELEAKTGSGFDRVSKSEKTLKPSLLEKPKEFVDSITPHVGNKGTVPFPPFDPWHEFKEPLKDYEREVLDFEDWNPSSEQPKLTEKHTHRATKISGYPGGGSRESPAERQSNGHRLTDGGATSNSLAKGGFNEWHCGETPDERAAAAAVVQKREDDAAKAARGKDSPNSVDENAEKKKKKSDVTLSPTALWGDDPKPQPYQRDAYMW
ncbi:hypothetical protein AAE478_001145 [Parahypoxylon ruwenzoriense]